MNRPAGRSRLGSALGDDARKERSEIMAGQRFAKKPRSSHTNMAASTQSNCRSLNCSAETMPHLPKSNLEVSRHALEIGLGQLGGRYDWPFSTKGHRAVSHILQVEQKRRQEIGDVLIDWIVTGSFGEPDRIAMFLMRARFWWGCSVLDSLISLPCIYLRGGSMVDCKHLLVTTWAETGLLHWKTDLENEASWYEAGKDDGVRPSFSA